MILAAPLQLDAEAKRLRELRAALADYRSRLLDAAADDERLNTALDETIALAGKAAIYLTVLAAEMERVEA